jgi:rhodanese-related sulfurtransferase
MTEQGGASIGVEELLARFGTQVAPLIVDVRRSPAFEASNAVIAGCIRREPVSVASWSDTIPTGRDIVVYCAHGQEVSQQAASGLHAGGLKARFLMGGFQAWQDISGPLVARHAHLTSGEPSLWVTRERPKIDRVACPWLIRRFVDPMARFLYTPTENVFAMAKETGAIPYDIPGAEPFTHDGPLCSFDTIIRHFAIRDPALEYLALIVRGADTARLDLTPQSAGLLAITLGLSANCGEDDHGMLEASMPTYDALYTWCRRLRAETHNWTPATARAPA